MLALNEALQKAGEGLDTRFSRVRYAPSGAISALLTEKANAGLLVRWLSNLLIRAAKTVDSTVMGVNHNMSRVFILCSLCWLRPLSSKDE